MGTTELKKVLKHTNIRKFYKFEHDPFFFSFRCHWGIDRFGNFSTMLFRRKLHNNYELFSREVIFGTVTYNWLRIDNTIEVPSDSSPRVLRSISP